jgi:hypothetical protein
MIRIILILTLISSVTGCNKIKEKIIETQALQFITVGQWKVVDFKEGGIDYSTEFLPYSFQFRTNQTVDAIKNGATEISGTWTGSNANSVVTIQSAFPQNAPSPLPFLNGTFIIDDAGLNYVIASKTQNGVSSSLRLEKK